MTLTFDRDYPEDRLRQRYIDLLSEYRSKLIKTEAENNRALAMIEKLMHLSNRTPEQQELYELLIVLSEKFEQEFYQPISETNPRSMLAFLMEQRDIQPSDLVDIFGSTEAVTDIAVVVWTEQEGDIIRIISARRANRHEQRQIEQYLRYQLGSIGSHV